ncbi:unnamed protein product [Musa banksii]
MIYRERKCLTDKEKLYCLILAPKGYVTLIPWPKSHDHVHNAEVHPRARQLKRLFRTEFSISAMYSVFDDG